LCVDFGRFGVLLSEVNRHRHHARPPMTSIVGSLWHKYSLSGVPAAATVRYTTEVPRRKPPSKKALPLPTMQPFADRLKRLRDERDLKQGPAAEAAGISPKYLGRLEGAYSTPSATVLLGLAQAYDVTVDYLLCRPAPTDDHSHLSQADRDQLSAALTALTQVVHRILKGGEPPSV
jgi:transcriptional regulator with XRE-family HTH domain